MLLAVSSAVANWTTVYERLLAGDVPFALTTYLPTDAALWAAPIGQDGIAVIVHATNPVPALTLRRAEARFSRARSPPGRRWAAQTSR